MSIDAVSKSPISPNVIWLVLCGALLAAVQTGTRAQPGPEPFRPFDVHAFRFINSVTFSPSGDELLYTLLYREVESHRGSVSTDSLPEVALFHSRRTVEGWSEPALLPFSGRYHDYEPALTPDGRWLVFNSRRPVGGTPAPPQNDLWAIRRDGEGWGEPRPLSGLNTFDGDESYATLTADGRIIYHKRPAAPDSMANSELFEARFENGEVVSPRPITTINSASGEGDPYVAPDGSYLLFSRWDERMGWEETCDLYIAFATPTGWSEAVPLTEVNTSGPDYSPGVSPDGTWLYYRANYRYERRLLEPVLTNARRRAGISGSPQPGMPT